MQANKLSSTENAINENKCNNDEDDENESNFVPQIVVFRSGIVCISQKRHILWFDSRGKEISRMKLKGDFVEMQKYYDNDTREFLIVGTSPKIIEIIDVTTFYVFASIKIYKFHFYPIKHTRSILASSLDELRIYNFGDFIPPVIMKYGPNESPTVTILKQQEHC